MTVEEIATWLQGELVGDGKAQISRVAKIEEATPGDLTFLANPKYEKFVSTTKATAILVSKQFAIEKANHHKDLTFIKVDDPYVAFLHVVKRLSPPVDPFPTGIHSTAIVHPTAVIDKNVSLGAHVVIGEGATIGANTRISHHCVIGDRVTVGRDCSFYPRVTVYHGSKIGDRVILHSGVVIGSDGFGFAPKKDGTYEKIPQVGIVRIEDDVEIGANCTIDRATLGETVLKKGVKLDNLVQVAHNVTIGENTVIAAQTGIAGSTKIGRNVMIGGQVGIAGHIEIADRAVLLAQAGISKTIRESGIYMGYPAKEQKKAQRMEAALRLLPDLMVDVRKLQEKVEELLKRFEKSGS
ncbi:MAG TPA: UDP-3-O-(3-hydroxymyristoyl)glucosamine N-acyltransferase [Bacteroidota bacterium]|nr:UDP-3-O-(3-hydroxymyristoyl)glucosamine N-acyltransferase [Bacteroidota bacterium]